MSKLEDKFKPEEKHYLNIKIKLSLFKKLEALSEKKKTSMTNIITLMLEDLFEKIKNGEN